MLITIPYYTEISKNERNEIKKIKVYGKFKNVIVKKHSYKEAAKKLFEMMWHQVRAKRVNFDPDDTILIDVFVLMYNKRSDAHKLVDCLLDIVQDSIKVNDKNFQINSWLHGYKRNQPKNYKKLSLGLVTKGLIYIKLTKAKEEYCPFEEFEKKLTPKEKINFKSCNLSSIS